MAVDKRAVGLGSFLIVVGCLFLAVNVFRYSWNHVWPLFLIAGGAGFFLFYFADRRNYGVLMPAALLSLYGSLFLFCTLNGWHYMSELWPTFILGPGLGLFLMFIGGSRETGLLIPAAILTATSLVFFFVFGPFRMYRDYWPVILIIAGIFLILTHRGKSVESEQ